VFYLDIVKIIAYNLYNVKMLVDRPRKKNLPAMTTKTYHHGDLKNALIAAGIEILANEGVSGLTLRKAARVAGVSHAAPYAHFTDKQALIAAISTAGYRRFLAQIEEITAHFASDPVQQFIEGAWAYMKFALEDPAHFRITFSGVVSNEKDYPALVEASEQSFAIVVGIVTRCQAAGRLSPEPPDLLAVSVWSAVHGLVSLLLNQQISHSVSERFTPREMLLHTLDQFVRGGISANLYEAQDARKPAT
jgi:AcrR family transcriptional regulator